MATTQYYQLKRWFSGEKPDLTGVNGNFTKIDAAIHAAESVGVSDRGAIRREMDTEVKNLQKSLKTLDSAKCRILTGGFSGNGAETRRITLDFRPAAVFLTTSGGWMGSNGLIYGGLATDGHRVEAQNGQTVLEITWDGFEVTFNAVNGSYANYSGIRYFYVVFA